MTVLVGTADGGARDEYEEKDRRLKGEWNNLGGIYPRDYECGYCGKEVGTGTGYYMHNGSSVIAICSRCNRPTFFDTDEGRRYPSSVPGKPVTRVSADLVNLYDEARYAAGAGAYTAAVMVCRKMLMNIAVKEEAEAGWSFEKYIDYLESKHLFSPKMKDFVAYIRTGGNDANHKIAPQTEEDAIAAIEFVGALIRHNYEVPSKVPVKKPKIEATVVSESAPAVRGNGPNPKVASRH